VGGGVELNGGGSGVGRWWKEVVIVFGLWCSGHPVLF